VARGEARASWKKHGGDVPVNKCLKGRIVDYTANHGQDNRIWSPALLQKRDLYVYLPPGYDPSCQYPIIVLLHGFGQDEQVLLALAPQIDNEISQGRIPPVIVAAPDGTLSGRASLTQPGSFFLNSLAGRFEDWVLRDMWNFVCEHYPIRPEREAHVLAGVSMGGFAAFNFGMRYRQSFGVAIAFHAPLNLRWIGLDGNYFANFDPHNWGWRCLLEDPREVVAKFYCGALKIRIGQLVEPLFGLGKPGIAAMARNNPIELIDATGLRNGELAMFVGYGGHDEFNVDAQVSSFLYLAKCRGLGVGVAYEPYGHHDTPTAERMWPAMIEWLGPRLAPYAPVLDAGAEAPESVTILTPETR
jgi:S-formylglutathione hydrolase FrmB